MKRTWLSLLRVERGLTQKDVALHAGISPQTYSLIENGGQNVSANQAKKIANYIGFEWTYFFCEKIKVNLMIEVSEDKKEE